MQQSWRKCTAAYVCVHIILVHGQWIHLCSHEGFAGQSAATVAKFRILLTLIFILYILLFTYALFANFMYSPVPGLPCLMGVMKKQPNGWPSKCLSLISALCSLNLSWYIIKISAKDPPSTEPQYLGCLQETSQTTRLRSMCQWVVKQKSCKSPLPRPSLFSQPFLFASW